jgi:hypothetical protein
MASDQPRQPERPDRHTDGPGSESCCNNLWRFGLTYQGQCSVTEITLCSVQEAVLNRTVPEDLPL